MLLFENVVKEFRLDNNTVITPVNSVNLNVKDGEFIVIVGRSGTGKTTLLNLAAGLVKPTSGSVKIDNLDLATMSDPHISKLRAEKIGFVFQFPSLFPSLTVWENVNLPKIFARVNGSSSKTAGNILGMLGLTDKLNIFPKQLSAGEQKRVVIARALINNPALILADEPTSDLDNRTEQDVMDILQSINKQGVTFLVVTHNLGLIAFATQAFEMEKGNLKKIK